MSHPVAVITGAASGMGLALSRHLLDKGWRVVMADINLEKGQELERELGRNASFRQVDVCDWDQQAALFKHAFQWGGDRIDFLAANAGIDDKQSLYAASDDLEPQKPNLKTLEVDLIAVYYGIWLFAHYARKNKLPGGKIVITGSAAGIYPMESNPQYTAAKHGLVGLTRAAGPVFKKEGITVNCILPAFVPTGLAPPKIIEIFPKEHITPMSTIIRAFDEFLQNPEKSGDILECSQDQLFPRKPPEFPNESQRWLREETAYLWDSVYQRG